MVIFIYYKRLLFKILFNGLLGHSIIVNIHLPKYLLYYLLFTIYNIIIYINLSTIKKIKNKILHTKIY